MIYVISPLFSLNLFFNKNIGQFKKESFNINARFNWNIDYGNALFLVRLNWFVIFFFFTQYTSSFINYLQC